jgi:hypothetical protein
MTPQEAIEILEWAQTDPVMQELAEHDPPTNPTPEQLARLRRLFTTDDDDDPGGTSPAEGPRAAEAGKGVHPAPSGAPDWGAARSTGRRRTSPDASYPPSLPGGPDMPKPTRRGDVDAGRTPR